MSHDTHQNPHPENADASAVEPMEEFEPMDVQDRIHQLRVAVLLVGAVALVMSLMFNLLVYTINNDYTEQLDIQRQQAMRLQANFARYDTALKQLFQYAPQKPAMLEVLKKYGVQLEQPPPAPLSPEPGLVPFDMPASPLSPAPSSPPPGQP